MEIRPPTVAELPGLQAIERAAGRAFIDVGRPDIADDDPFSLPELRTWLDAGRCWVAEVDGDVRAYVVVDLLGGAAHIEQISVHPDARGARLGAALIDHVATWAATQRLSRLTLTTFVDVPWNAPYYERLGFTAVTPSGALEQRMVEEAEHGLRRVDRVAMQRSTAV